MAASQMSGGRVVYNGLATGSSGLTKNQKAGSFAGHMSTCSPNSLLLNSKKRLKYMDVVGRCSLSTSCSKMLLSSLDIRKRKRLVLKNRLTADCNVHSSDLEGNTVAEEENDLSCTKEIYPDLMGIHSAKTSDIIDKELVDNPTSSLQSQNVKGELVMLSLPAIAGQAIEPLSQLLETAYIGGLGAVELASAGVSVTIFNNISKLFNIPLLSVATSFVAEDISKNLSREVGFKENTNAVPERQQLASVSTALLLAVCIGIFEAVALSFGSGMFLNLMGITSASSMHAPAQRFISIRALGAPAVVVSLALQGVFRGFKDTKTPMVCLGIGNFSAIFLLPLFMYHLKMGVSGAAISTVVSQYIVTFLMIWQLNKRAVLLPPRIGDLQFGGYMKSGGFLIGRTLSVLATMTLATSMAARQGPVSMAAHQVCLQVWLAVSLITDALAASGQALIAGSASKGDYEAVKEIAYFVLKIGLVTGVSLAAILGLSFSSIATLFTKDTDVLKIVRSGVMFVAASQPLNALAFIFDGLHYGVSDFRYAAYSMMLVGAISSAYLLYAPSVLGLPGVWSGLALFMALRMLAGCFRLLSKDGPWWFLHGDTRRGTLAC